MTIKSGRIKDNSTTFLEGEMKLELRIRLHNSTKEVLYEKNNYVLNI